MQNDYKSTRIGLLPANWKVDALEGKILVKARIGWKGLKANEYTKEGPYLIAGKHIKGTKIEWEKCDHLSQFRYEESPEIMLQEDDIIMSKDGTIGRVAHIFGLQYKATINGTMMLIRPLHSIISKYLFYYLQGEAFQKLIKSKVAGSSVPHIFQKDMNGLVMPIPSLIEQQKIAKILTTVDNHISEVDGKIEDLKELKKGLMQKLLTEGIGHTEFKDSPVGRIPIEWEVKKIRDISDIKRGASPRPIKDTKWFSDKSKIGWIRISDVSKANKYLNKTEQFLSEVGITKSRLVNKNELIMSICASVGKPIIMNIDACIHDGFVHFSNMNTYIHKEYVYYFLQTKTTYFKHQGQTGTQANLNTSIVGLTDIPIPSIDEQEKIAYILACIDVKIENMNLQQENYSNMKKGLMQQLLTGKTRVKINE